MTIESLALTAILALANPPPEDVARLEALAADVSLAVQLGAVPFAGPAADAGAALALVAIAAHEAGPTFAEDVADCRRRGDLNISASGSVSLWQLLGVHGRGGESVETVCQNQSLAALLGLRVLSLHSARCSRGPWLTAFQGYAGGKCGHRYEAAADVCHGWQRLAAQAGLTGANCYRRDPIAWKD